VSARGVAVAVLLAAALCAGGCDRLFGPPKSPFKGIDVSGGAMGGDIRLNDHHGRARTLADFRGKLVVVSFGFTHCPDVCPTTLADIASAMKLLGARASEVQVLFVTVDPRRDTPQLLSQYVPAFDASFLGMHGDNAAIEKVKKDFHVYAQERPGKTPESYSVDHSAQVFAIDRQGRVRLIFAPNTPPSSMAADLAVLLDS
jgi:protein SCO1/2